MQEGGGRRVCPLVFLIAGRPVSARIDLLQAALFPTRHSLLLPAIMSRRRAQLLGLLLLACSAAASVHAAAADARAAAVGSKLGPVFGCRVPRTFFVVTGASPRGLALLLGVLSALPPPTADRHRSTTLPPLPHAARPPAGFGETDQGSGMDPYETGSRPPLRAALLRCCWSHLEIV